jgi:hypothetical protein
MQQYEQFPPVKPINFAPSYKWEDLLYIVPCIPEPSVNNKLKRREGSGSTGRFFSNHKTELVVLVENLGLIFSWKRVSTVRD